MTTSAILENQPVYKSDGEKINDIYETKNSRFPIPL
jgi:hypothetical protein